MKKPAIMNLGLGLGLLGGIVAVASLGIFYEDDDGTIATTGAYLLAACLYFALGGAFAKHGQWSSKVLAFMAFVTVGIIAGGTIAEYYDPRFGVVGTVIAVAIIVIGMTSGVKKYVDSERTIY